MDLSSNACPAEGWEGGREDSVCVCVCVCVWERRGKGLEEADYVKH